ncbi:MULTISPECIES: hypothetical protein [Klebsiella]|uniref:hypothetical protein n=1 Tax=Klebsiella TaxID=570 RepID=UPI003008E26E
MSTYVSPSSYARSMTKHTENCTMMLNSNSRTTSQRTETKIVNGSVFSGLVIAALLAFLNVGASTSPNVNSLNSPRPIVTPVINRNGADESELDNKNSNLANVSDCLQSFFGFNTAQWAKILKVERKTIYNWRKAPETKHKTSAAERVSVLQKFAEEFNPDHTVFFKKFLFGSKADAGLMAAFMKDPLELSELLDRYDDIYTKLDGLVKRKALLGE